MNEEWRPISGFVGYEISSLGQVRSYRKRGVGAKSLAETPKLLKQTIDRYGYLTVHLSVNGKSLTKTVHRLLAKAFLDTPPSSVHQAAHIDGNSLNNIVTNIYWATPKQNSRDRVNHGTQIRGVNHHSAKLDEIKVKAIREEYAMGYGTHKQLAMRYGVTKASITGLLSGKNWAHV